MQSNVTTVTQYLASLPTDRRVAIEAVRRMVRRSIDKDVSEGMQYGMIGYFIPHRVFPGGYHCDPKQPLPYLALASQKNYMSLYLMFAYVGSDADAWLRTAYAKAGKRLDMGKCCLRFRTLEELDLDIVAEAIRRVPSAAHIASYVQQLGARKNPVARGAAKAPAVRKRAPAATKSTRQRRT